MDQLIIPNKSYTKKDRASMTTYNRNSSATSGGFTLIELLVVIIIIAILAAIIYPVFSSALEHNRQSSSISNMHDISSKIAQYELDKHAAPPVLFGYADGTHSMDTILVNTPAANQAYVFPGLYPTYINDVNEFIDPNNDANLTDTASPDLNTLCPSNLASCTSAQAGTLQPVTMDPVTQVTGSASLYEADSYDMSPEIGGNNALVKPIVYVARYQPAWTGVTSGGQVPPTTGWSIFPLGDTPQAAFERQLHWQFPPADTYVTSTTYHIQKANVVLVLYQSGSVIKLNPTQFTNRDAATVGVITDPESIAVNGNGVSAANFWQILPSGQ